MDVQSDHGSVTPQLKSKHRQNASASEQVSRLLVQVEEAVVDRHVGRLIKWSDDQRVLLRKAWKLEDTAIDAQARVFQNLVDGVQNGLRDKNMERTNAKVSAATGREDCIKGVYDEFRKIGKSWDAIARAGLHKQKQRLQATGETEIGHKWKSLEQALQKVLWQRHTTMHRSGLSNEREPQGGAVSADDIREVWTSGELSSHLVTESDGWGRSQRTDLAHLLADVNAEFESKFQDLEDGLRTSTLSHWLAGNQGVAGNSEPDPIQQLRAFAENTRARLSSVSEELLARYSTDISGSLHCCEEDYRKYDCELHSIQVKAAQRRFQDAAAMRRLKLALCHWRLDYQQAFHESRLQATGQAPSSPTSSPSRLSMPSQDASQVMSSSVQPPQPNILQQRFDTARHLVRGLWSKHAVPPSEVHAFLSKVAQAAARDGNAAPLLKLYRQELKRYGALALVEHAQKPELLQCWFREFNSGPLSHDA
eukprot:TRINITY_DN20943_c0_g1_i1.p1 TRINITY_DN20943_c0_g1~~TRINITY_DN20943_c0_g1_i1.p1  ORF type:complete len:479 (-),score=76.51 TRINITY_DN20943_c0_g1_i1:302-1738(-)